jgi:hypothetical protein
MFELHTKDMTPRERRDWWRQNPCIPGRGDLGVALPSEATGKTILHRLRKLGDREGEVPEQPLDSWYNTGSVTSGIARTFVNRYNTVKMVRE